MWKIVFALAALADIISTEVAKRKGGLMESNVILKALGKEAVLVQLALYGVAGFALCATTATPWVYVVASLLPIGAAINNIVHIRRSHE